MTSQSLLLIRRGHQVLPIAWNGMHIVPDHEQISGERVMGNPTDTHNQRTAVASYYGHAPEPQLERALHALESISSAVNSGDATQIAAAICNCDIAAKAIRHNDGAIFMATVSDEDGNPVGMIQTKRDDRGVIVEAIPSGQSYPYSAIIEIDQGAGRVVLGGAAHSDDAIADCHLDSRGAHVQAYVAANPTLRRSSLMIDGTGDITICHGDWEPSTTRRPRT